MMPTLDELHSFRSHIRGMKERAPTTPEIPDWAPIPASHGQADAQWRLWLNEALDAVLSVAPAESYLKKQAETLRDSDKEAREQVFALLDAAERAARLKSRDAVTDDLRRAVEIAVKDEYFEKWPFKALAAGFVFLAALVFGGTLWSGWQVQGVQKNIDQAQESIRAKSAEFEGQISTRSAELEKRLTTLREDIEKKTNNVDQTIRTALEANSTQFRTILDQARSDVNGYVVETKRKLDEEQTRVIAAMNEQLRDNLQAANGKLGVQLTEASKSVDSAKVAAVGKLEFRAKEVDENRAAALTSIDNAKAAALSAIETSKTGAASKLDAQLIEASKSVDTAKVAAISTIETSKTGATSKVDAQFTEASKSVDTAKVAAVGKLESRAKEADETRSAALTSVDSAKAVALSAIETSKTVAVNKVATYQAEVEGKRDETLRAFAKADEAFLAEVDAAHRQIAAEIANLPEDVRDLSATLTTIDRALSVYHLDIARAVATLSGSQPRSSLELVVDVLGRSFWLVIGALGLSLLALGVALYTVFWPRGLSSPSNQAAS